VVGSFTAATFVCVGMYPAQASSDADPTAAETDTGAAIAAVDPSLLSALATPTDLGDEIVYTEAIATDPATGTQVVEGTAELDATTASIAMEGLVGETFELEIVTANAASASLTEDGAMLVQNSTDIESLAITHEDASVQVIASIAAETASERIDFVVNDGEPANISIEESGLIQVTSLQGELIGFIAAPWAYDATGASVPTHFEVDGSTVTQVIEHQGGDFTYPIVADPWGGKNLFTGFTYNVTNRIHSFKKSEFGGSIHYPTNYQIFLNEGWAEFRARTPGQSYITTSIHQQYDCHAAGGYWNLAGPTWDLEVFRPARTNGNWFFGVAFHHCNWTTANQY